MKALFTLREINFALGYTKNTTRNNNAIMFLESQGVKPRIFCNGGTMNRYYYPGPAVAKVLGITLEELNDLVVKNKERVEHKQI